MTISNLLCSRCAKTNLASRERTANHTPPSWRPSWCHGWWSPTGRHIPDVWGPCPFNSCDDTNVFRDWVKTSQWNKTGEGSGGHDGAVSCPPLIKTFHPCSKMTCTLTFNGYLTQKLRTFINFTVQQFLRKAVFVHVFLISFIPSLPSPSLWMCLLIFMQKDRKVFVGSDPFHQTLCLFCCCALVRILTDIPFSSNFFLFLFSFSFFFFFANLVTIVGGRNTQMVSLLT